MKETSVDKLFIVYEHKNKSNGKRYFGITSRLPTRRWGRNGGGYRSNRHFWNAIQKYGWDGFEHNILFSDLSLSEAEEAERSLILQYHSDVPLYGYNHTKGGECGCEFSEESRRKMSESGKGKEITDEWRKHLSESRKGKTPWNKGKHLSEEHKKKVSDGLKGNTRMKDYLRKIGKSSLFAQEVSVCGTKYASIKDAADALSISEKQLAAYLRGENSMPEDLMLKDVTYYGVPHEFVKQESKIQDKIVYCEGIRFNSMSECDRYYGLRRMQTSNWLSGHSKIPQEFIDKGLCYSSEKRYWYKILTNDEGV